nr:hypothetical protein [Nitrospirota bacterium]
MVRSTQLPALEAFGSLVQKVAELERRLGGSVNPPATAPAPVASTPLRQTGQPVDKAMNGGTDRGASRLTPQTEPVAEISRAEEKKAAVPQVPAPESAAIPAPVPVAAPEWAAAWAEVLAVVQQQKPYLFTYLTDFRLVEIAGRDLVLGCPAGAAVRPAVAAESDHGAGRRYTSGAVHRGCSSP